MDAKLIQPEKVPSAIFEMLCGISILMMLPHLQNAHSPIFVTVVGISMLGRLVQPSKAQNHENQDYMIMMVEKWRGGG